MTPQERKEKLDSLAERLFQISKELDFVLPELTVVSDQNKIRSIVTDLHWAAEHCTTIGLHQIGQVLEDKCGAT